MTVTRDGADSAGALDRRRRWADLARAERVVVVFSVVATAVMIPYAVIIVVYLSTPDTSCDKNWSVDPLTTLAWLGTIATLSAISAGIYASVRHPRLIGLTSIAFNMALLVLGFWLLALDWNHGPACLF